MKEKTPLSHEVVYLQVIDFGTSKSNSEVSKSNSNILVVNYSFLENYVSSEGVVSHNVLHYQQLSTACYQVSFYANNYFESLPIVSSGFKAFLVVFVIKCDDLFFSSLRALHFSTTHGVYPTYDGVRGLGGHIAWMTDFKTFDLLWTAPADKELCPKI